MMIRLIAYQVLVLTLCLGAAAQAQTNPRDADVRSALAIEIDRLERDLETLRELTIWQGEFLRAARVDPESALRQRRHIATCTTTLLAPICGQLPALFQPNPSGTEQSPPSNGAGRPGSGRAIE